MKKFFVLFFTIFLSSQLLCQNDIVWGTPVTLSTLSVNASSPQVVMDANGNLTAAWVESGLVKASNMPFGGSFSAPTTLSGSSASSPNLAVDSNGNVVAVWVQSGVVNTARLPFGGSWSGATALSASGASAPQVVLDPSGNATAIWLRSGYVESKSQALLGIWSLVASLISGSNTTVADLAVSSGGTVIAVWHSVISGSDAIQSSQALTLGVWSTPITVINQGVGFIHNYPQVALDPEGNASIIWYRATLLGTTYANVVPVTAFLPANASVWGTPLALTDTLGYKNPSTLFNQIISDSNGNVYAMWTRSSDGDTYNLESAIRPFSGSPSSFSPIVFDDPNLYAGAIAINTLGDAVSVFMDSNGGPNAMIQAAEVFINGNTYVTWSQPITVSQSGNNGYPQVGSTVIGNNLYAGVVWINSNGVNNTIQASIGTKSILAPPTMLSVVQTTNNEGIFTEYYNTISWTLSTDPTVAEYYIFRNGVLITNLGYNINQYVDRNAVQNGSVTYSVVSIDEFSGQSIPATISYP